MIGLERNDIYITNIRKISPPNNRDPLPEEKTEMATVSARTAQYNSTEIDCHR